VRFVVDATKDTLDCFSLRDSIKCLFEQRQARTKMPELCYYSLQKDTSSEIQHYFFPRNGYYTNQDNDEIKKDKLNPLVIAKFNVSSSLSHDIGHVLKYANCLFLTLKLS
jgi:hypothetical protein